MPANSREPGAVPLSGWCGWVGLAAMTVFLLIGGATRLPDDAGLAITGVLVAVALGVPLFLVRPRFLLVYAVATTGGIVVANAEAHDIGWFAVCVVAAWCVVAGGIRVGVAYWLGSLVLFGCEWLFAVRDAGWSAWVAGVTFTVFAAGLVRHQLVLVERLRAAQAGLDAQSRAEERNRIARELHDVIAHNLTVSLLHIASARLAVEHDPADAVRALLDAERLGRQSLAEVRATMGMPQSGTSEGIAAPVPGINDLRRLVDQVRDAGVDVSLAIEGDVERLPATTGSTVYRIVQEALTNAAKHAPGASVAVSAAVRRTCIEVNVDSAGSPGRGAGMGLVNMRTRAEAVGGTCTAGPGGRGWLVRASLPVAVTQGADLS